MLNSCGFFASCFLNKELGLEILHNGKKLSPKRVKYLTCILTPPSVAHSRTDNEDWNILSIL